ncbi:PIN domain-containing protein [Candidatus Woesearchaeota archaeon]|nr:PIN domain-containing protein [Candidatus Woesearchaeota archaeon]
MKIILDVNAILSALIRDSTTRKIILNSQFDFYFPEPSLHKIRKYKDYILEKSGLTEDEYDKLMATLFKYIKLVPTEEIEKNWDEAKKIMEHIDPEDVVFIATALSIADSVIWSDDRHFEKQDKVKVLKTEDIIN